MFSTEELTLALLVISRQLCKGVCWEMNNILIAPMSDAFMITKTLYPVISSYSLKMCDNVNIVNLKNTINILILFITGCYGFYCGTKMYVWHFACLYVCESPQQNEIIFTYSIQFSVINRTNFHSNRLWHCCNCTCPAGATITHGRSALEVEVLPTSLCYHGDLISLFWIQWLLQLKLLSLLLLNN